MFVLKRQYAIARGLSEDKVLLGGYMVGGIEDGWMDRGRLEDRGRLDGYKVGWLEDRWRREDGWTAIRLEDRIYRRMVSVRMDG